MQSLDKYFTKDSRKRNYKRQGESNKRPKQDSSSSADSTQVDSVSYTETNPCESKSDSSDQFKLRKIKSVCLDLDYGIVFPKYVADKLFHAFEQETVYDPPTQFKIYGKVHEVNRKVTCYGDDGLKYMYSGVLNKAKPWPKSILDIKTRVEELTMKQFNFVLVNRYDNGSQYMGEHRDDEKDLDHSFPIASVSFGQNRDFTFRHKDSRGKGKTGPSNVKILLEHGSLLVMKPPTNHYWYHCLPKRGLSVAPGARINLTFRKILEK